ncbi:MAG: THUMP domain-containing protein [Candidatus Bathyarchaeia archaeon]
MHYRAVDSVLPDFNLIATSERGRESEACSELWMMLRAVGDEKPIVDRSPVRGLILARTNLEPVEAVRRLRDELLRSPDDFQALLRVLPIERVIPTDLDGMTAEVKKRASRIGSGESFRVTVEKRRTKLRSREIIEAVAAGIDRRVDLEHPDWVVLIEIVGRLTGVSVVRPGSLLNIQKTRFLHSQRDP